MCMICLCLRDVKELKLSTLYISLCTSTWQINDLRCLHCLVNSPMRSDDMKQTSGKQNSSSTQYHSASFQVDSTFFGNKSTLWLGRGGLMNESPENLTMKPSFAMALPFLVVLLDTQKSWRVQGFVDERLPERIMYIYIWKSVSLNLSYICLVRNSCGDFEVKDANFEVYRINLICCT